MVNLKVARMIQIGATGRNSGKTMIAKQIIQKYCQQYQIYGIKIITITGVKGICQRGTVGCGICTSIDAGYELIEETKATGLKDTMQLLQAGCQKVYLLKAFRPQLLAGFQEFLQWVPLDALIVCESNSLREVVEPGVFIMMNNKKKMKQTARKVIDYADVLCTQTTLPDTFDLIKRKDGIQLSAK